MLLKKAKMNRSKFLPVRPSKPVFHTPKQRACEGRWLEIGLIICPPTVPRQGLPDRLN